MLATSKSRVDYLTQSMQMVSNELQATIDVELQKLKDEEKTLKNALRLKTRQELITTMERELAMGDLNENTATNHFLRTSASYDSHALNSLNQSASQLYQTQSNASKLNESIRLSDDHLRTSRLALNKLTDECSICSTDLNQLTLNNTAQVDARSFLQQSAHDPTFKNQFADTQEFVNPNVVRISSYTLK